MDGRASVTTKTKRERKRERERERSACVDVHVGRRTGRNAAEARFRRLARPTATRVHLVREPAESRLVVDAGRRRAVPTARLGARPDLVGDVAGQRATSVRERVDEHDAGQI